MKSVMKFQHVVEGKRNMSTPAKRKQRMCKAANVMCIFVIVKVKEIKKQLIPKLLKPSINVSRENGEAKRAG